MCITLPAALLRCRARGRVAALANIGGQPPRFAPPLRKHHQRQPPAARWRLLAGGSHGVATPQLPSPFRMRQRRAGEAEGRGQSPLFLAASRYRYRRAVYITLIRKVFPLGLLSHEITQISHEITMRARASNETG